MTFTNNTYNALVREDNRTPSAPTSETSRPLLSFSQTQTIDHASNASSYTH